MAVRARVCAPGQTGSNPDGTEIDIVSGSVTLDATANVRGTLDLTAAEPFPVEASDLLAPYGNEIFVERGIVSGDGVTEWVGLGYFRIRSASQDAVPRGAVRVSGEDRMAMLVETRMTTPRSFSRSQNPRAIMDALVHDVAAWISIQYDNGTDWIEPSGRSLVADRDRFGFLDDLVASMGRDWFFDHRGMLVIGPAPDPRTPVFEVNGGAGGVLVSATRELSRDSVYNAVVAIGQSADDRPPVTAIARDTNPASPTRWDGPFGKVPAYYESEFLSTVNQAADAAKGLLVKYLGVPFNVSFDAVPNPALQPLDPVKITIPGEERSQVHIIDSLTIPLDAASTMTATTRELSLSKVTTEELT